ncbi:AI-2E family transporter [Corynebacterium sp. zg254]|uniref:AI-2E family transporter n=2 Tax=Corynebacteriaceae TaxID=1653 RepID=A0ABQ6VFR2_9CORY|nr:AI-2E family transporter [Corynebacterium zhongnanshanii]MCR5913756.1 AI-2E family transporter [Corynebacterium sp. zg254]
MHNSRMTSRKNQGDPRDHVNGRDLADLIAGSDRLDPQTQLPLPEDQIVSMKEEKDQRTQAETHGNNEEILEAHHDTHGPDAQSSDDSYTDESDKTSTTPINESQEIDKDLRPELRDRAEVIGSSVRWFTGWCVRFIILIGAAYLAALAFGKLWAGVLPVLLSLIVCTMLWPVVRTLRNLRVPNALAVFTTILGFFAVVIGVFWAIAPSAVDQSRTLINQATDGVQKVQEWLQGPPLNLQESQFNEGLEKATQWLEERAGEITSQLAAAGSATVSAMATLLVMLVLTFFFLKDGEKFLPMIRRVTGRRVGWHLTEVLTRCWNTLGGFIRTQAIVSFIDAFFIGLGLVILNVPLAGVLAVLTFFAGFIPIVGAITAGALSVLIALVANGLTNALLVLALIILVQQLESNVLQPVLQSRAMNVHPVVILLAVTIGSTLFGIVGAFLAVPVAAMIMVVLRYMGDLTDLATGERTAQDIDFATTAGSLTAERSEQNTQRWLDLRKNILNNQILNQLRGNDK